MIRNFLWQFFFFSLVMAGMAACESGVTGDLKLEYDGDQLSVSGFISPDSIWIQAGKTVNGYQPFSIRDFIVPGIQVFLVEENGAEFALATTSDGFNFREKNHVLSAGVSYKIRVKAPGFEEIITEAVVIPDTTGIPEITHSEIDGIGNGPAVALHLGIEDKDGKDFYFIGFGVKKDTIFQPAINWVIDELINEKCYNTGTFTDNCFAGQKTTLLFGTDENYYFGSGNVRERGDAIVIRFGKVSEALYQSEQSEPNDDGFIEGINELPATYSNVSNGHGVVFGQNWKEYQIKLN